MDILGMSALMLGTFTGFGLLIGILFGFFGMGGSFLVTPALLVMGFRSEVAVGSGLAFVFGTSVIGALRHRGLGQVDYKLAALMVVGMTSGIEVGKYVIEFLSALGALDLFISVAYIGLLALVGLITLRDARSESTDDEDGVASRLQDIRIPPLVSLNGGSTVSLWIILAVGFGIGILSGILGVGGGFLLMPAMMYGFGVPAAVAVGTDILQITLSGAFGAFTYAQSGYVNIPVVAALLGGSALGARIGAAATGLADEDDIKGYFAAMLLAGSLAVASKNLSDPLGIDALETVSIVLILGSALLVSATVVLTSVRELRAAEDPSTGSTAD
ncbi:sulfite exporter TauE/SafE family protein [Salarchaeum sp. JOR-1]|uniref:sulfite exporter TauE/SafE family protein n=1 Tax=Salarchaeum sp. JOR-1 TaxID=2599399 RepID=UPI001F0DC342|nr:sulfite exporter TauE/SafE family protein [Salarchaeum sp. JOR-1]